MMDFKVKVTIYKNNIVVETLKVNEPDDIFLGTSDSRIDCALLDTNKETLGISEEAITALSQLPRSRVIPHFNCTKKDNGKVIFEWAGDAWQIRDLRGHVYISDEFDSTILRANSTIIKNDSPQGAKLVIDI